MIFGKKWREEKQAERAGRRDGRMARPPVDWTGGPTHYLMQLHSRYEGLVFDLRLKVTALAGQSLHADDVKNFDLRRLEDELSRIEAEQMLVQSQMDVAQAEKIGAADSSVGARAGRHREIPTPLYIVAVIALMVGEFLVTVPAARRVLGDSRVLIPILGKVEPVFWVALSISVLSVILAHLFGLTLKARIGRDRPQPAGIALGFAALAVIMLITLLFLSALRSAGVSSSNSLLLPQSAFGTLLFFALQLTFIGAATGLAFYNHSEIDSRISLLRRQLKKLQKMHEKLRSQIAKQNQSKYTPRKIEIQLQAMTQEYQLLSSRYNFLANLYINSNLLMQPQTRTSPGPGLTPQPLPGLGRQLEQFIDPSDASDFYGETLLPGEHK
jgi:hypothetical protein